MLSDVIVEVIVGLCTCTCTYDYNYIHEQKCIHFHRKGTTQAMTGILTLPEGDRLVQVPLY